MDWILVGYLSATITALLLDVESAQYCLTCSKKTNCENMVIRKCLQDTDICFLSWTGQRPLTAGCFPLPSFADRTSYSKLCQPWNINDTYTCLCRRNGCNKMPRVSLTTAKTTTVALTSTQLHSGIENSTENKTGQTQATSISKPNLFKIAVPSVVVVLVLIACMFYGLRLKGCRKSGHSVDITQTDTTHVTMDIELKTITTGTIHNRNDVYVKLLSQSKHHLWSNECKIYSLLCPNKNIATFIDSGKEFNYTNQLWLSTRYCAQGTLKDYLQTHELNWETLIAMAKDISHGLSYLHKDKTPTEIGVRPAIAHQDLKSKNIFIEANGTCVIGDFGLALELSGDFSRQLNCEGQVGTLCYMAPEKLEGHINIDDPDSLKQIDIYSLALIYWELLTRCHLDRSQGTCMEYMQPYSDLAGRCPSLHQMIDVVCVQRQRPGKPQILLDDDQFTQEPALFWTTITECWDHDPEARLTADCVCQRLESLYRE